VVVVAFCLADLLAMVLYIYIYIYIYMDLALDHEGQTIYQHPTLYHERQKVNGQPGYSHRCQVIEFPPHCTSLYPGLRVEGSVSMYEGWISKYSPETT